MKDIGRKINEVESLFRDGNYVKVIEVASSIVREEGLLSDETIYNALFYNAHAHKNLAHYKDAEIQFNLLIEKFPKKYQGIEGLVNVSQHQKQWDKVIERATIFQSKFPNLWHSYWWLGQAHKNLAHYKDAEIQFNLLIEKFPKKHQGIEGLVNVSQHQKQWDKVIERATIFQNEFPNLWHSYWWLGEAYKNIAQYKEAVNQFNLLIEKFPKRHQGIEGLVNVSQHQKHWNKVIERSKVFQSKFPNLWHSYWWLGQAYKNIAQYKEAVKQFNLLIEKFPEKHQGIKGLITVYQSQSNWTEVFRLAEKLIELYPDLWLGYWYLGEACFNMCRYDEALKPLTELQVKAPNHILGINFYANTLNKLGRCDEAKKYLEEKIKFFPNARSLKDSYIKLYSDIVYEKNNFSHLSKHFFIEGLYNISEAKVVEKPLLKAFWWDAKPNFGDWIGPLLIKNIFNIDCVNMRNKSADNVLYTVGSVIQMAGYQPHQNVKIWGSGLIRPLDTKKPANIFEKIDATSVLSLRGKLTYHELSKYLDIDEEELSFGDPALLLPRIYEPKLNQISSKDICIVPHYVHKYYFLSQKSIMDNFNIVDVQTTPSNVINQIASSKICISSSLHGVIIAQAYGIPWIWLKIEDDLLTRDQHQDFKFFDFFSVMDYPDRFNKLSLYTKDINVENINVAAKEAKIMEMSNDFQGLIDSLSDFIYGDN